ncbi:DUF2637 domain-containing protein [Streptomyces nigrescens]|uniref:DUF2637 domain-containing protein n=1 Tax=Streptomyces nigrescens TaxID=1920 RepID=UPI003700A3E9
MEHGVGRLRLNRAQRALVAVVVTGAVVIAAIGFTGSYSAVRELAARKGFGTFAIVFPIGVDAGIAVLLALDLLLTWLRIPFPTLRQAAWLLTAATIGFNSAAAWPDPIGTGMHSVIPVLFVVTVEAARHAVGRLAAITADRHIEGVRLWRWLLAPLPTFRLWRRMMLWEIRKYADVIEAEQQRLVYQAHLRSRFGRGWRWKAPVEDLLPLRITRYGVPLDVAARARTPESGRAAADAYVSEELAATAGGLEGQPGGSYLADASGGGTAQGLGCDRDPSLVAGKQLADADPSSRINTAQAQNGRAAPKAGPKRPEESIDNASSAQTLAPPTPPTAASSEAGKPPAPREPGAGASDDAGRPDSVPGGVGPAPQVLLQPAANEHPEEPRREFDQPEGAGDRDAEARMHTEAIAGMKSKAAAVRYAMKVLGSTHTPTVVDWLAAHGREVNRGQAHRITQKE